MHETQRTLKDRDRENRHYNPELEGHRHPLFASVLPHVEVITALAIGLIGGIGTILAGFVGAGAVISIISGALLAMAGWVSWSDPAKRIHK